MGAGRAPSLVGPRGGRQASDGRADVDPFVEEFRALKGLGYDFAEGDEWSPRELFRKFAELGLLRGGF